MDVVPQTQQPNHYSIDNTNPPVGRNPTRDLFANHTGKGLDLSIALLHQWTIEASIRFKPVDKWENKWQCFIVRDGYNMNNGPALDENPLPNLTFKKRGDNNRLCIEAWDSTLQCVNVQSKDAVLPEVWYHVAAVCDGRMLSLYLKSPGDKEYQLQNNAPFTGALLNSRENWAIGRGAHNSTLPINFSDGLMK